MQSLYRLAPIASVRTLGAGLVAWILLSGTLQANEFTWAGAAGEFDWNAGANWVDAVAPPSAVDTVLIFNDSAGETGSGANPLNQNIADPMDVDRLEIQSGAYVIGGDAIRLNASGGVGIRLDSTAAVAIQNDLILGADAAINWQAGALASHLTVGGDIDLGAHTLRLITLNQHRDFTFDGVISGTGAIRISGHVFGPDFAFNEANTFSGGVFTEEGDRVGGRILLGADNALGTGRIDLAHRDAATALVEIAAEGGPRALDNDFRFSTRSSTSQPHSRTLFSGGSLTLNGDLELNSDNTINHTYLDVAEGTTVTVNGVIKDLGTSESKRELRLRGDGTFVFTSENHTYAGETLVGLEAGGQTVTLQVDGDITSSSGVLVHADATLRGTGSVPETTVESGGILYPGSSVGTLTVEGMVNMNDGSILQIDIEDDQAGRVAIMGTGNHMDLTLGNVTLNITGTLGTAPYTIVTWEDPNADYGGFFEVQLDGDAAAWDATGWEVSYGDTSIMLIPEPGTLVLLLGGGLTLLAYRRSRV